MKKIASIILVLCLLLTLCACGTDTNTPAPDKSQSPATDTPADNDPAASHELVAPAGFGKKEITVIVPLTAGGAFDLAARKMAECVNNMYGINMVVENVEGGSGLTGMTQVLTSAADGYTLGFYSCGFYGSVIMDLYDVITLDMVDPLVTATTEVSVLCVNSGSGITNYDELKEAILAGGFAIGGPGSLNSQQVGVRAFSEQLFGEGNYDSISYVSFAGGARIAADLMGDSTIDAGLLKPSEFMSGYEAGDLVPILVLGEERLDCIADVPTAKECGLDFSMNGIPYYSGIINGTIVYAPTGLDPEVREYLIAIMESALLSDDFQAYVDMQNAFSDPVSGDELAAAMDTLRSCYDVFKMTYFNGLF